MTMRFFTPDLYVRFNSSDEKEADRANEAWEAALSGYRKHLDGIRDCMPSQVRNLSELNLHDAEVLACDQAVEPHVPIPYEQSDCTLCGLQWQSFQSNTMDNSRR
jgi:hypothetical protein